MKKIFDKWKGGAKKHGGFANAMAKQMKDWGVDLDESLGKPSGVKSVIPEKRKESENKLKVVVNEITGGLAYPEKSEVIKPQTISVEVVEEKESILEEHTINIDEDNLRTAILEYIEDESIDEDVAEAITILIAKKSLSNAAVASKVLKYGNPDINSQVKAWVMNHIDEDLTISKLKLPAALYFVKHSDQSDVSKVIKNAGDNVEKFAEALFATEHPELSSDVATCLLLGEFDAGFDL